MWNSLHQSPDLMEAPRFPVRPRARTRVKPSASSRPWHKCRRTIECSSATSDGLYRDVPEQCGTAAPITGFDGSPKVSGSSPCPDEGEAERIFKGRRPTPDAYFCWLYTGHTPGGSPWSGSATRANPRMPPLASLIFDHFVPTPALKSYPAFRSASSTASG